MKIINANDAGFNARLKEYLNLQEEDNARIEQEVLLIRENVRKNGFKAIQEYSRKFDSFELSEQNFAVSREEIDNLASRIDPDVSKALELAVERIKFFHKEEFLNSFTIVDKEKNKMGQNIVPIDSAAIYIPGGEALYPSTLYMTVIPAIIAGVRRIAVLSPPRTFERSPEIARLMQLLGINEAYRIGGAHAIFAACFGVKGLDPVEKIAGPGNIYVAAAKKLVYGKVDIDMIAGPSEILVIADTNKSRDISLIASDLLSQAEHGPAGWTRSILIGTDEEFLIKIREETYRLAESLPDRQKNSAIKSLDNKGLIIICTDMTRAVEISNFISPEHLELFSYNPYLLLGKIRNAGSVFLGRFTPESVGDYVGGPNHVLPTDRTARFFSPLGVYSFQKRLSWIEFNEESLKKFSKEIGLLARSEGLEAHARSVEIRFKKENL